MKTYVITVETTVEAGSLIEAEDIVIRALAYAGVDINEIEAEELDE